MKIRQMNDETKPDPMSLVGVTKLVAVLYES
jgi:hypothetical protein